MMYLHAKLPHGHARSLDWHVKGQAKPAGLGGATGIGGDAAALHGQANRFAGIGASSKTTSVSSCHLIINPDGSRPLTWNASRKYQQTSLNSVMGIMLLDTFTIAQPYSLCQIALIWSTRAH